MTTWREAEGKRMGEGESKREARDEENKRAKRVKYSF